MGRDRINEPMELDDGRKVSPVTIKRRGRIFRVQFPDPITRKNRELSTGRDNEAAAWVEATRIVNVAYSEQPKTTSATWDNVIEELPTAAHLRPESIGKLKEAIVELRKLVETDGPADITPAKAQRFRHLYSTSTYTRSPKPGAKQYTRKPKTVNSVLSSLNALWSKHLRNMGYVTVNVWEEVPRQRVEKKIPRIHGEEVYGDLFTELEKGWELITVFLTVKALSGCRTMDLCSLRASDYNSATRVLTFPPELVKTHQERQVELPPDLAERLDRLKGEVYLWDRYSVELRQRNKHAKELFDPTLMRGAIKRTLKRYKRKHGVNITPHSFRRRAFTLSVQQTGSLDATANIFGVTRGCIENHYNDPSKAFNAAKLFKQLSPVLMPKTK